jgi:hypothetical protein
MRYANLNVFLEKGKSVLAKGPVAILVIEDLVEVDSTLRHHLRLGFKSIIVLAPDEAQFSDELEAKVHRISYRGIGADPSIAAINAIIKTAPGTWFYYAFNAEYLFFPFCETRTIGEMISFIAEERRDAVLAYVVDLYADDLTVFPNAVSIETARLDKSGYYALGREEPVTYAPKERQLNFFGGLRWRFEEHIPYLSRKIDRIAIFKAKPGLQLRSDHTFNDEEYNTYACPWHHNITVAIASFRTAKALKTNAGSTFEINTFNWHNSTKFEWHSQQLLDLGLMEPGQWF